jgi:hypothetical protein
MCSKQTVCVLITSEKRLVSPPQFLLSKSHNKPWRHCQYSDVTLESRNSFLFSWCLCYKRLPESTSDVARETNLGLLACICMYVCVCVCVCVFLWVFWYLTAVQLQDSTPKTVCHIRAWPRWTSAAQFPSHTHTHTASGLLLAIFHCAILLSIHSSLDERGCSGFLREAHNNLQSTQYTYPT